MYAVLPPAMSANFTAYWYVPAVVAVPTIVTLAEPLTAMAPQTNPGKELLTLQLVGWTTPTDLCSVHQLAYPDWGAVTKMIARFPIRWPLLSSPMVARLWPPTFVSGWKTPLRYALYPLENAPFAEPVQAPDGSQV